MCERFVVCAIFKIQMLQHTNYLCCFFFRCSKCVFEYKFRYKWMSSYIRIIAGCMIQVYFYNVFKWAKESLPKIFNSNAGNSRNQAYPYRDVKSV
ncbi:hypothetical protein D3C73_1230060 [compost metagenome]